MNINLYPDQQKAYETILERYENGGFQKTQLLPAETGYGKSMCGAKVAYTLKKEKMTKTIIICPSTLRNQWKKLMKEQSIDLDYIFSYHELRGKKGKLIETLDNGDEIREDAVVKHKFLTRDNSKTGGYMPTLEFEQNMN